MWALAALLLAALGAALGSLYVSVGPGALFQQGVNYVLVVGVSGLTLLFSLYMLLKQRQLQSLRAELFQAIVTQESLRARLSGLSTLFEGAAHVGAPIDVEVMLQALADHVRAPLRADRASLMLLDPESGELHCVAVSGRNPDPVRGVRVPRGAGIAGWVVEQGQAIVLTPDLVQRRFPAACHPPRDIAAGLCVPVALRDQVIGVLNLSRVEGSEAFTEEDARILTAFAAHIAIAIRSANDRRQAREIDERHAEQQRQSQKMESLGRLAGGVAHDFNNLLTVILSYGSKLLRGQAADDPMRQCAEKITEAAERCAALTRQLLTFSRKQVVTMRRIEMNACVQRMSVLLRRLIGENVELETVLAPNAGSIQADSSQIEQVLMNLVVNARDALPAGGRVTITTERAQLDVVAAATHGVRPGPYCVLAVRDTGHGMDAATQAKALEPFFTTKEQSTGLGLSTVYGIVQQSGGFLAMESRPGYGSTFRIGFPSADSQEQAAAPRGDSVATGAHGATILLVEDEQAVRELVRELLSQNGFQVLEASWAGEAVMIAESHEGRIDLMLTDVVMPGESGGELARWMEQARPEMPVLFMSGYSDDAIVRAGVQHGAAFLAKPFSEEDLIAKVRAMLAQDSAAIARAA
jgi:signal transduction histidine kinase/CheY-like chemotaxis protein